MSALLEIDGSRGEGGGQVLRTSLALAAALGRPFAIRAIRARRPKPGLLRQHLACVRAAAATCGAEVRGAELGSQELEFRPGALRAVDADFAVGSAGSALLVLQTVLPPLLLAGGPSRVRVEGGTHNRSAPPFEHFAEALLPLLARAGARAGAELLRPGFEPAGGGAVELRVEPAERPQPLELLERGRPEASAEVLLAHLPGRIAEDELAALQKAFGGRLADASVRACDDSTGPGNAVLVRLDAGGAREVVTAFGARGIGAQRVGRDAGRAARRFLDARVPVGEHTCDQLMLPLALLAGGAWTSSEPTLHARTNAGVIAEFLGEGTVRTSPHGNAWRFEVRGRG